jgi:aminoglycoside phosphotransferase family enzyme/predicted kinase
MNHMVPAIPEDPARHRVIETHVSLIAFDGDTVRKRKKAVRLPFIDLTTPESRLAACRQEVALNRRLAPDVYLGVDEIRELDGRLIDAAVVMRRLPSDKQLSTLIAGGADVATELTRTAHVLAAFHSRAARSREIDRVATVDGLAARWEADLDEWDPLIQRVLGMPARDRDRTLVRRYLEARAALLEGRIAAGHIVDGHGDLRADSIFCLADRPRLIDCLEFDANLRFGDELADVAFLAMDLEGMARPDLAGHFVRAYARFAGWTAPPGLLHFYMAQRALVRSKVACWRVVQGDAASASQARRHLEQCRHHLEAARPLVIAIGGAPRTGKTTIARGLADEIDGVHLASDEIRRDVAAASHQRRADRDPLDRGMYTPVLTALTYRTLASRTRILLHAGYSVVLDATFANASSRREVSRMARACRADFVAIECRAPTSVVQQRARDILRLDDHSEATPEVAAVLQSRRAPWRAAHAIETTTQAVTLVAQCLSIVRETPLTT